MRQKDKILQAPVTKGLVFVKGSWSQMGKQYGANARDAVMIKCMEAKASYADRKKYDKFINKKMQKSLKLIEKRTPQIKDLWRGIAKGAGLSFFDIIKTYTDFRTTNMQCSNISAWGKATSNHTVKCGMNCDEKEFVNYYAPSVIAYPNEGYPFISASALTCNCVMNNQGLVLMASCGQNALEKDVAPGLPNCISLILCAASCKTAEEAKEKIIREKLGPGGGENIHIVDKSGVAFVIEHTADKECVRKSGKYGETDYLLATNHFITQEMDDSNFSGRENQSWMNSYFRYWTEKHMLDEYYGRITLDVMNQILGCKTFWGQDFSIINEKKWTLPKEVKKGWNSIRDMEDKESFLQLGKFSPEIQTQKQKCVFSVLLYPEQEDFYILNGCRDTDMSMNPWTTGIFTKITLKDSVRCTVENIQEEASRRIFESAKSQYTDKKLRNEIREAKTAFLEGVFWKNKAICEKKKSKVLYLWNKSATAFLRAQEYAYLTLKEIEYDESKKIPI